MARVRVPVIRHGTKHQNAATRPGQDEEGVEGGVHGGQSREGRRRAPLQL